MSESPVTAEASGNLLDLPFIIVATTDNSRAELGLVETLRRADELVRLDGETAAVDAALLRLMVAIVLLALSSPDEDPMETWLEAWHDWSGTAERIVAYLEEHRTEFELFDSQRPFLQQAGLKPQGALPEGFDRLVAYDGQWCSVRDPHRPLTPAEAARWLLYTQSFGLAGIQTGQRDDPTVKGGKGYPTGYPAWAGNLGLVIWHGDTLAQTILLNSPLDKHSEEKVGGWQISTPVHSRRDQTPPGAAALMTWPNRRILLHRGGDGLVHSVQVSYGDTLTPQNKMSLEPMSAWRVSVNQGKKAGVEVLMPVMHQPERHIWRGIGNLLANDRGRPATAAWLSMLCSRRLLDPARLVRMQAIAVIYGPQNSTVQTLVDDSLVAPLGVLTSTALVGIAEEAVAVARDCVGATTHLADQLALATGAVDSEPARERAARQAYARIDPEYREWLATLDPQADADKAARSWHPRLRRALLQLGREMVIASGPAGVRGRVVADKYVTSAASLARFEARIRALTPGASPTHEPPEASSTAPAASTTASTEGMDDDH